MALSKLILTFLFTSSVLVSSVLFAGVAADRQEVKFVPIGGGKPVVLSFDGRVYKKGLGILIDSKAKDPLALFINRVVDANSKNNREKVVNLWNPVERKEIKAMISNDRSYEKNRSLFRNILSSRMAGFIVYGNYILCYVDHNLLGVGSYMKLYPLIEKSGQYYLTNELSSDFLYTKFYDNLGEYLWGK